MKRPYEYGNEVARAVAANAPVVALETTVVTHGLPRPHGRGQRAGQRGVAAS